MVFATPPPLTPRERQKLYPPLPSFQKNLVYGGGAGLVGALFTFPIDTAKTRVQNEKVAPGQQRQYRSITSALLTIRRTQGLRGLYNGLQVRLPARASTTTTPLTLWRAHAVPDPVHWHHPREGAQALCQRLDAVQAARCRRIHQLHQ